MNRLIWKNRKSRFEKEIEVCLFQKNFHQAVLLTRMYGEQESLRHLFLDTESVDPHYLNALQTYLLLTNDIPIFRHYLKQLSHLSFDEAILNRVVCLYDSSKDEEYSSLGKMGFSFLKSHLHPQNVLQKPLLDALTRIQEQKHFLEVDQFTMLLLRYDLDDLMNYLEEQKDYFRKENPSFVLDSLDLHFQTLQENQQMKYLEQEQAIPLKVPFVPYYQKKFIDLFPDAAELTREAFLTSLKQFLENSDVCSRDYWENLIRQWNEEIPSSQFDDFLQEMNTGTEQVKQYVKRGKAH